MKTQGGAVTRVHKRVRFVSKVESNAVILGSLPHPVKVRDKKKKEETVTTTHSVFVACFKIKTLLHHPIILHC